MPLFRKSVSVLLLIGAVFIGLGLVLAPPANPGVLITLVVMPLTMLAGAFFAWPRPQRSPLIDQMINDPRR